MKNCEISIIGGGNMGSAIIDGLMKKGKDMQNILLIETDESKRKQLEEQYNIMVKGNIDSTIEACGTIIVAVKPQNIRQVFTGINPFINGKHLIISVAAGITLKVMERYITKTSQIVRTMPNIAARVGKSVCAMCYSNALSEAKRRLAIEIMESIGWVIELEEEHLDTITGFSGSGPAFVFLMIEALTDSGVLMGISREKSYRIALETVFGSAYFLKEYNLHPAVAKEMVTSPGGTAIEGLLKLEESGFKALIMNAVRAATEKASQIGKKNAN
ncbi:MAG: pyrroline-5-carboxylate reductase [Spirochaetota bacterium]|nr:MAG: pyrroline-5-carboxylate reductase [Spirochaetota bacterium]